MFSNIFRRPHYVTGDHLPRARGQVIQGWVGVVLGLLVAVPSAMGVSAARRGYHSPAAEGEKYVGVSDLLVGSVAGVVLIIGLTLFLVGVAALLRPGPRRLFLDTPTGLVEVNPRTKKPLPGTGLP